MKNVNSAVTKTIIKVYSAINNFPGLNNFWNELKDL